MTEAIDNQAKKIETYTYYSEPTWAPGAVSSTKVLHLVTSRCLKRPETTRNPFRPDGTRPRSPWNTSWFRMSSPASSYVVAPSRNPARWYWGFIPSTAWFNGNQWNNLNYFKPPAVDLFYQEQVARTKVLGKVSQKKWDLGVSALELKQTAGLVTDLAQDMVKTLHNLVNSRHSAKGQINRLFKEVQKHGDFYKAAQAVGMKDTGLLESLKDRWMQYQFGIKPVFRDVDDASKALNDLVFKENHDLLINARAGHTSKTTGIIDLSQINAPFSTRLRYMRELETHYSVTYKVPKDGVSSLTTLGLDNPWSVAWEVTRLSWMVDYVVGIGDWLQSFTAANGLSYVDGSKSTLWRVTPVELLYEVTLADQKWQQQPSKIFHLDCGEFRRELVTSPLLPGVVPQIKTTLGLTQLGNSLFALSNVFSGKGALR